MNVKTIIIIVIIVMALAGFFAAAKHFEEVGYAKCKKDNDQALAKVQTELIKLRAEHVKEQDNFKRELAAARTEARRVVVRDPAAVDWWSVPVPDSVTDYVYGRVQPADTPSSLRP